MIIRFLPYWLGMTLGRAIYIFVKAFASGAEQNIRWNYELFASVCIGFISTCLFTTVMAMIYLVVMAAVETRWLRLLKVRIW